MGAGLLPSASAELSSSDKAVIKEMTQGSLYLRNNVPCRFTSGMGIGAEVVTEVSPTGVDWDKNLKAEEAKGNAKKGKRRWAGVNTIYWGFGPNDMIHYGKLYYRGNGDGDQNGHRRAPGGGRNDQSAGVRGGGYADRRGEQRRRRQEGGDLVSAAGYRSFGELGEGDEFDHGVSGIAAVHRRQAGYDQPDGGAGEAESG